MYTIPHRDAMRLESMVCKLFNCDRAGVSGLADAGHFESRPLDAAIMIVSYIHAKGLQVSETQYDGFLCEYNAIFTYPEKNDAVNKVQNYIEQLNEIVDNITKSL